jgi:hypothetical protein
MGVPTFVVSHRPPSDGWNPTTPFTFVHDGVESAIAQAQAVAGSRDVGGPIDFEVAEVIEGLGVTHLIYRRTTAAR